MQAHSRASGEHAATLLPGLALANAQVFFIQDFPALYKVRIEWNAIDGAYLNALRLIKMTDTLRAEIMIDDINLHPLRDRVVRTFRLADITVDTFVGNH